MNPIARAVRPFRAALALGVLLAMTGCSMDDVEFNGGLFNAVGIGQKTKSEEPKMAARSGIVLPPSLERLPAPGEPQQADPPDLATLNDPDRKLVVSQAELERQQEEYCRKNYELAKAHGDTTGADLAKGPLGPCRGSILNVMDVKIGSE